MATRGTVEIAVDDAPPPVEEPPPVVVVAPVAVAVAAADDKTLRAEPPLTEAEDRASVVRCK